MSGYIILKSFDQEISVPSAKNYKTNKNFRSEF